MTLVSLLLVLLLERVVTKSKQWQLDSYFSAYYQRTERLFDQSQLRPLWQGVLIWLLPVLLVYLTQRFVLGGLLSFLLDMLILYLAIGCSEQRQAYKAFLQSTTRGDEQAGFHYAEQLGWQVESGHTIGQQLLWLNYRFYAAVIVWFALFGGVGVLFYSTACLIVKQRQENEEEQQQWQDLLKVIDWLPVRIVAFGYVLMGHFSNGFAKWSLHLPDFRPSAYKVLTDVASCAEDISCVEGDVAAEACTMVRLGKRTIIYLLVIISILTIGGLVH